MDMLRGTDIAAARLADWRHLAQGIHARYLVDDFAAAARFVAAVADAGDEVGHHPRVRIGTGHVDLELVSDDAVYRDDDGTEYVVEWVTQEDVDLARRIGDLAAEHGLTPDPSAVTEVEIGLTTSRAGTLAPVWAALLTGNPEDIGRGTPGDEIRDATARVPNLMFTDTATPGDVEQRFVVEVYVAPEVAAQRLEAVLAAGGTVVDDSEAPGLVVVADQDGNRGILCTDTSTPSDG